MPTLMRTVDPRRPTRVAEASLDACIFVSATSLLAPLVLESWCDFRDAQLREVEAEGRT